MFTVQKIRLFFNDPKFREKEGLKRQDQEEVVNKIFTGQKQLRRTKVILSTIANQDKANVEYTLDYRMAGMTDFLQSRLQAYQNNIVSSIQKTYAEKERIKQKYNEAENLYEKASLRLKQLMGRKHDERNAQLNIVELEREVEEIRQLYEENNFLKNMNADIAKRIEQKQIALNKK